MTTIEKLQQSPADFRNAILIDTDQGPRPFAECIDPWQAEDFAALDDGWRRATIGTKVQAKYQRGYLERPRGHSKTQDLALMCSWALFASRRPLSGIGAAGDQDQAGLLPDAVGKLCHYNPWLGSLLTVQNKRIVNEHTNSSLEIISSDAPTSYGLTPDFLICDEVVHWKKRDLWDALISSAAKRSTCMLMVISNAGWQDDWTWDVREAVRTDPKWYFHRLEGPTASWITQDQLDEQSRLLPKIVFDRLWNNSWGRGCGDLADVDSAFFDDLQPLDRAEAGWDYVAGIDAGVTRDASAICILGVKTGHAGHGTIRLAHTKVWEPDPKRGKKVNLVDVEEELLRVHQKFRLSAIYYDPSELRHMASRLQSGGLGSMKDRIDYLGFGRKFDPLPLTEVPFTTNNLQRMATAMLEAYNDQRLALYNDPDLKRDLQRLQVQESTRGYRLVFPRVGNQGYGEAGTPHGDLGTAFVLATLAASDYAAQQPQRKSTSSNLYGPPDLQSAWESRLAEYRREQEFLNEPSNSFLDALQGGGVRIVDGSYDALDPYG